MLLSSRKSLGMRRSAGRFDVVAFTCREVRRKAGMRREEVKRAELRREEVKRAELRRADMKRAEVRREEMRREETRREGTRRVVLKKEVQRMQLVSAMVKKYLGKTITHLPLTSSPLPSPPLLSPPLPCPQVPSTPWTVPISFLEWLEGNRAECLMRTRGTDPRQGRTRSMVVRRALQQPWERRRMDSLTSSGGGHSRVVRTETGDIIYNGGGGG